LSATRTFHMHIQTCAGFQKCFGTKIEIFIF
jgi:hypothetical protein